MSLKPSWNVLGTRIQVTPMMSSLATSTARPLPCFFHTIPPECTLSWPGFCHRPPPPPPNQNNNQRRKKKNNPRDLDHQNRPNKSKKPRKNRGRRRIGRSDGGKGGIWIVTVPPRPPRRMLLKRWPSAMAARHDSFPGVGGV